LLEKHHEFLKESIPVLLDKVAPTDEKQHHLTRFLHLWNMHSKAEEETLYPALLNAPEREAHIEGLVCLDEHKIAKNFADELQNSDYESYWSEEVDAKAKVLANTVQNHIREEERHQFSVAKRDIHPDILIELSSEYLERCKHYLDLEIVAFHKPLDERMIQRGL
jgi:hemerythrin-like domain-containing protein